MSDWKTARIIGVIPARMGSQRLPGKPLHPILGKPLIQYVWENAKATKGLEAVVVATDDERIVRAVEAFGGQAAMTSATCASGSDRCAEILEQSKAELIVNIQGDEPLLCSFSIDQVASHLLLDTRADIVTLRKVASPSDLDNQNVCKVVCNSHGYALYFSRLPIPFVRDGCAHGAHHYKHIGIYGYRAAALRRLAAAPPSDLEVAEKLEQLRALDIGLHIKVAVTPFDSIGVDRLEDVATVESILRDRN